MRGVDNPLAAALARSTIRERILSGALPAGAVISQVELAADLGISRTPVREALRRLQEEGLVEAEPNRRCRVTALNLSDLDGVYGARLMLEALGMRLTLPTMSVASLQRAELLLDKLETLGGPAAGVAWHRVHHQFHQTFVAGAPALILDQIVAQAQLSERYVAQSQVLLPEMTGRAAEHREIVRLVRQGQHSASIAATARHFARTPLLLLAEVALHVEPTAIRAALSIIGALDGASSSRL